ncbi:ATP-binding cassette domain-containing protein [Sporosarcina sp. resist]|uniref:ABC transporter ATP-binding protein n=1 Tax=Sporosarcina sp. resist TaxID=2762563 RepID=UPI00164D0F7C|nr:ABC transporter ATP-binding protein [Sporosarcina sp. resist]QNK88098.1 ATP-binding cassette domain-containing protein [Sporosarcina sp. resist]
MEKMIIKTKNLSKKYKHSTVVDNISLEVRQGEIYGFLGPNGAGKTTTIRMLLGLIKSSNGEIRINGKSVDKNRIEVLKNVGSLVESPSYYGNLTAFENLKIIAKVRKIPDIRINEVLQIVGLNMAGNKLAKNFSLGMKQRLGIGAAILGKPELLILDEPTNGLDPSGIEEIRELIKSFPEKYGMTIIISSHLLSEIDRIATHVGIINKGRLIFQGEMSSLRNLNESCIHFHVEEIEKTQMLLTDRKIKFANHSNGFVISKTGYKEVAAINKLLVENKINIYRIEEQKESLEKIFLNLIRKDEENNVDLGSNRL